MRSTEDVLLSMVQTVEDSKNELFSIQEESRLQLKKIEQDLQLLHMDIEHAIREQDRLHVLFKQARERLAFVSQSFEAHSEEEVKAAYTKANEIQMQLFRATANEESLKRRRSVLQEELIRVENTMKKSQNVSLKLSIIVNYLGSDVSQLVTEAEETDQLHAFGLRMLEMQEEERKHLSREIHDGPAQMMAHLVAKSDLIEQLVLHRPKAEAVREIRSLKADVREALTEVRRLIYDIRPMALDDLGIVPTLQKYLNTVTEKHHIKTDLKIVGERMPLSPKLEATVFRIVQESVNNVLKHGKTASLIRVRLEYGPHIHLFIIDNGVGLDPNMKKEQSFGILGMRERVSLFDGELKVRSVLNEGTTVSVHFPLDVPDY